MTNFDYQMWRLHVCDQWITALRTSHEEEVKADAAHMSDSITIRMALAATLPRTDESVDFLRGIANGTERAIGSLMLEHQAQKFDITYTEGGVTRVLGKGVFIDANSSGYAISAPQHATAPQYTANINVDAGGDVVVREVKTP
jgi:hypothetical protein